MAVTEQKKAIVAQMKETLSEAKGAVLIGYTGLTVAQATDLRRKMLAEGVEYKVIKNTLTRIAANELNLEGFAEHLEGPTALATSKEDAVAPARVIEQFIKATEQEVVTVKGTRAVKGGLSVEFEGLRGFIPASMIDTRFVRNTEQFVGQEFDAKIKEVDPKENRFILSRREVVEAQAAACLYKGAVADDGNPRIVEGDLDTIMAGLACGEPNTVSWDILRNHADVFVSAPDWVARLGMRVGGAPIKGDTPITTGESGAVPLGLVTAVMTMPEYEDLRKELELDASSKVLCFSTEGDTDPERYKNIMWYGEDR